MTCDELKKLLSKVSVDGIKSLSDKDIMDLLENCCDTHNSLCDCGDDLEVAPHSIHASDVARNFPVLRYCMPGQKKGAVVVLTKMQSAIVDLINSMPFGAGKSHLVAYLYVNDENAKSIVDLS